jgi:hypothetical protein
MSEVESQLSALVPGLCDGLRYEDAFRLILEELLRLKEIEKKYEGLCK